MANWRCTRCGDTATSKCVTSRTVFPGDQMATIIGERISWSTESRVVSLIGGGEAKVVELSLIFHHYPEDVDEPDSQALEDLVRILRTTDRETLTRALCHHHWQIEEGETCLFGCHEG